MTDVEKYAKELIELSEAITATRQKFLSFADGTGDWGIKKVVESYLSMFDRFCPFKVGDRVALVETLDIPKDSGWYTSRHFLVRGEIGTVTQRGYRNGEFEFYVMFDNETRIDRDGKLQPVDDKHNFVLPESALCNVRHVTAEGW